MRCSDVMGNIGEMFRQTDVNGRVDTCRYVTPSRRLGGKRSGSKPACRISETSLVRLACLRVRIDCYILCASNKPGFCIATGPALPLRGPGNRAPIGLCCPAAAPRPCEPFPSRRRQEFHAAPIPRTRGALRRSKGGDGRAREDSLTCTSIYCAGGVNGKVSDPMALEPRSKTMNRKRPT